MNELIEKTGDLLVQTFELVTGEDIRTGEPVKTDQDLLYDVMDRMEFDAE